MKKQRYTAKTQKYRKNAKKNKEKNYTFSFLRLCACLPARQGF